MAALKFFFYMLMKPTTLGMAFLGICGIFASSINPCQWWVPALSALFMPVILVINIFLLIYWWINKKWWIILPFVTIIGNYHFFIYMFQSPWKKNITLLPGENKLSISSYNVEGFYWIARNTKYDIKQFVKEHHIDILCIQEHCEDAGVDSTEASKKFGLSYRCTFFYRQTTLNKYGLSIYSRHPIICHENIDFRSNQNAAMWADIMVKNDTIRVFNNHLQTTNVSINQKKYEVYRSVKNWRGQARTLVKLIEELKKNFKIRSHQAMLIRQIIDTTRHPVIVCGDFNDTPISFAFNHIASKDITDGFRDRGKGYGNSFKGIKGLLRIDFIGYDNSFVGLKYDSPNLPWSDHNPIIMDIALKKKTNKI